ncbi:ABC transporter permease [bacterium]|nr:MAG: ABC transporter permease [bacterium]
MRLLILTGRRLVFLIPQLIAVSLIVFFLARLLPGDPAVLIAGQFSSEQHVQEVRVQLGLDKPLFEQYIIYVNNVFHGNFGTSWRTSATVVEDVKQRLPGTLELVFLSAFFSVALGIPFGVWTAVHKKGVVDRVLFGYGMLAGSIPDFWLGLILIFFIFGRLGWLPGPIGQLDPMISAPRTVTGAIALDALITGNWVAFKSAVLHLVLPVATLTGVYMPLVMKNVRLTMEEALESEYAEHARAMGLPSLVRLGYALRNSLPPVVTVVGILIWYLLGGAVLVETVFAWGGLGQYAVASVVYSDYAPLQAFVLLAAVFTMVVFLLVDIAYYALDPRIKA